MNLPFDAGDARQTDATPHEGEMAACVRQYAVRHPAPERLVEHFSRLAQEERRESRWQIRRFWQVGLASALAASLLVVAGWTGLDWLLDSKDPYDIVAQEAKSILRQADTFPAAIQARIEARHKARLDSLFSSFNKSFHYRERVSLRGKDGKGGKDEFALEGATLREVDGKKVAQLIYRTGDTRLLLTVIPAENNPEWPDFLRRDGWVVLNQESPRTFVWRKGAFIYSLLGDLPLERFQEFSAAVSEKR